MSSYTTAPEKPLIIGVSGGSCTGKNTLCSFFDPRITRVIDLDAVAKNLSRKGGPIWKEIVKTWGTGILDSRGNLCRHKLRKIVFKNRKMLLLLNQITHPLIYRETRKIIAQSSNYPLIVINGAILWEGGFCRMLDYLVVVRARPEVQKERLRKRGLSASEAEWLVQSQFFQRCLEKRANLIIENNYGCLKELEPEVRRLMEIIHIRLGCKSNH